MVWRPLVLMARKPRVEVAGGVHHVWARGTRREPIFVDDEDRRDYLSLLGDETIDRGWSCLAFCLMTNHVHLLIETPEPNLGVGMGRMHGLYARKFNRKHQHTGHLFEQRYGSKLAEASADALYFASYIALNPVKAGLCALPEDWRWSSHAATAGLSVPPDWLAVGRLLEVCALDEREQYLHIVEAVRVLGLTGFEPAGITS